MSENSPQDPFVSATDTTVAAEAAEVLGSVGDTSRGVTRIDDVVVSKIAGLAAREVSGVYALGGGAARMVGAIRESFAGSASTVQQGVSVEVGERQAAVDVAIVAEYGVAIHELAEAIRRNIINAVERMTGLEVTEVNVTVHDVHLDLGEDEEPHSPAPTELAPRVQ
ncbi:Asp23/Gls24 family envelope stress response protein [Corynebacterium testudinoris]|uniref:Alkaline shock protein 23 n=1 Tax=Corynebacterium testudinoris TaxID=136857 RepID=A0A0G3H7P4_9CORY|nr:Asp23/Gls24 family envelope stress response protein [Corynebacterium testudinoris]AKK07858.1 hypothetical protein CTEST_02015 [Corynebacterium testudinoris]MBX8996779.1 Asp23/Gls24 family envelope stress response protein [Corynebacterium testudinoris]